jgi:hypothetical protein
MYYDLVASLPQLPHFARAERLPITPLRLTQRLRLLTPDHARQLARAQSLILWRPPQMLSRTDADLIRGYVELEKSPIDRALRQYVAMRMEQQTLLWALRRKLEGLGWPEDTRLAGLGPLVHHLRRYWEEPAFRLQHVHPWLPAAGELLAAGDALGLERLLMDVTWRWLDRCAQQQMFDFRAVFAYFFRWDMLQAWLVNDAEKAKIRFSELIEQVTHGERN